MPSSRGSSSKSRSPSSSHGQSTSSGRTSRHSADSDGRVKKGLKGTLLFLGAVVATTFAAHKYWPKGVIYGDKAHWEHDHHGKQAKQALRNARDGPRRRETREDAEDVVYMDREERRAKYRQGAREAAVRVEPALCDRARSRTRDRPRSDPGLHEYYYQKSGSRRDSSREQSRERSRNRRSGGDVVERRRDSYYPPAPRRRYYEDTQSEPVYVSREPSARSRRVSTDRSGRGSGDSYVYY